MPVQIHISGDDAGQALQDLAALSAALISGTVAAPEAPEAPEAPKKPRKQTEKPAKAEEPEQKAEKPEPEIKPAPEETKPESQSDEFAVTVEELRAKASEIAKQGKQADVKALLAKYEAKAVSSIPEDKRAAFMTELEALADA
ncbi:hypothetical protein J31TS4_16120 [Paenibacillus sp. J31TS4]|uniref:hypothetical protein n=1 Tax=Paenibacillus sp. J31TS4 TaxID=2807195 RepID=UPI001B18BB37|nr:hypothetical protein [Paenibacillus sp. J31TS4]GIP38332.1 hypothetical protein J31TS4_16120 [Paenibacillus sp. J31TS4]